MKEVSEYLNEMIDSTVNDTHEIANNHNSEPLPRRIAAILMAISASDHPLCVASTRAIIQLTETEEDSVQEDPLESNTGKNIIAMAALTFEQLEAYIDDSKMVVGRQLAARVVLIADGRSESNPHLELVLEMISGHDLDWWLSYVRTIRNTSSE